MEAQREIGRRLSISLPVVRAGMVMEVKFHNCQIETEEVGRLNRRLWPEEVGAGREGRGGAGVGGVGHLVLISCCVCAGQSSQGTLSRYSLLLQTQMEQKRRLIHVVLTTFHIFTAKHYL